MGKIPGRTFCKDKDWHMTKKIMTLFFILSVICLIPRISFSEEREKRPLSLSDIERLLNSGVISNKVIVRLISERGINFAVTEKDIDRLKTLGANDDAVNALRQASSEYEERIFGNIYVESDPPGAKVSIDGLLYTGKTPLRIEKLPSGNKKLIVHGVDDYGKFEGEIMIKPAKTISLKVQLPKLPPLFSITVNTDIPFAQLYLTGNEYQRKNIGITERHEPIIVENLNQGEYVLELEKEGYLPIKEKIYLNENKKFNYTLEKAKTAFLTVKTRPSAAEVYINENYKGISPLTLEIKTGSHMVTAKNYGYKDGIRLVYLKDKEHKEIDIVMKKEN